MPLFITFEGVEGSGKTTQIRRLKTYLSRRGIACRVTREPGGSPIGEKIRKILLNPDHRGMVPLTELLLYEAARAQHVKEVIAPLLRKGVTVLCDRFSDASVAYQGYGRRLDVGWVEELNRIACQGVRPDVTFLLDCPSSTGLERAVNRNRVLNQERESRFEKEDLRFHRRVRKGYLSLAEGDPRRVKRIDTRKGVDRVFEEIRRIVDERIGRTGARR